MDEREYDAKMAEGINTAFYKEILMPRFKDEIVKYQELAENSEDPVKCYGYMKIHRVIRDFYTWLSDAEDKATGLYHKLRKGEK